MVFAGHVGPVHVELPHRPLDAKLVRPPLLRLGVALAIWEAQSKRAHGPIRLSGLLACRGELNPPGQGTMLTQLIQHLLVDFYARTRQHLRETDVVIIFGVLI